MARVTIYGGSKVDFLYLERNGATDNMMFNYKYMPSINEKTILLCNYTNTEEGLGAIIDASGITFTVYREKIGTSQIEYVTQLQSGSLNIYDYNVANQTEYRYLIFPETETASGAPLQSNIVETHWWDWSVTGLIADPNNPNQYFADPDNIWLFDMNLESAEQLQHYNKTIYDTFGKFPRVSQGKLNYTTGGVSCLIGNLTNNKYYDTIDMIENWREFCATSNLKLLKDRKGQKMIVDISESSNKIMDETNQQANIITFQYVQLSDGKGISIIEER